jgi:hypothetical protein
MEAAVMSSEATEPQAVENTVTMHVVPEPVTEAATETPAVPDPPAAPDPNAALAAAVAAVNEEVERRMAANLAGIAASCEALDIELNAYVADAIKGHADYMSSACQRRGALCEQRRSIVWAPYAHHSALVAATLEAVPVPAAATAVAREAWTAPLPLYDGSQDGSAA